MAHKGNSFGINKKFIFTAVALFTIGLLHAQTADSTAVTDSVTNAAHSEHRKKSSNEEEKNKYANYDLTKRAIDHFMFQFGYYGWTNGTQTGNYYLSGFSRQFNAYFMLDHPFKYNPHLSLGYGIGYASDNAFMNGRYATLNGTSTTLEIATSASAGTFTGDEFKKFKIVFTYAEIPLELRWSDNIENPTKGLRFAVGLKGGLLLSAHSKAKGLLNFNSAGQPITSGNFIEKVYSKQYFSSTRAEATFRVSLGIFTLYGTYQLTPLLKTNAGPTINPYSAGIGLSLL